MSARRIQLALASAALSAALLAGAFASAAQAAAPSVNVFPVPGALVASPQTQITFRGVSASRLGTIEVWGTRSGIHSGHVEADSDGDGGSFLPSTSFTPGETVWVKTSLHVVDAGHPGTWHFTVATPSGSYPQGCNIWAPRVSGDVWTFKSRPDLTPAAVEILHRYGQGGGSSDIFVTPQYGPVQNGPEIVSPSGQLVWFDPVPHCDMASDLMVQQYHGQPVLTWWQGYSADGMGFGKDMIYNSAYQPVATVSAGNGLQADLHEFQITPQGTALITAFYPVYWRYCNCTVFDSVVQEIDIPTGLVLFQWDSLDHVSTAASYTPKPAAGGLWDYFHINSIQQDFDGNLVISARNTWTVYKVNHQTGKVKWTLGGKYSTFRIERGAGFAFQHDVRDLAPGDHWLTMFDDGGGGPRVHAQSRALELYLSYTNHTAWLAGQWFHSPPLAADFEGNVETLQKGRRFVGWGEQPYFTEYGRGGIVLLDSRFVSATASYRAYRFVWNATPATPPALVGSASNGSMTLYMSWNGATGVASWQVLTGDSPNSLTPVSTVPDTSFESSATVPQRSYAEVQAIGSSGNVIGTSPAVKVS